MNRIICVLSILFLGMVSASAQTEWYKEIKRLEAEKNRPLYRHEVGISIGAGFVGNSRYESFKDKAEEKYGLLDGSCWCVGNPDKSSFVSIKYFYHLKRLWAFGGSIGYIDRSDGYYIEDWHTADIPDTDIEARTYYLMPAVKGQWVDNKGFALYSKIGFGVGVQRMWLDSEFYADDTEKDWCVHPVWQITILGMEFGFSKFRVNFELGFGWEGVSVGSNYYFGRVRK